VLARHFLRRAAAELDGAERELGHDAVERLLGHDWPGNVRELQNRMLRAATLGSGDLITATDLGFGTAAEAQSEAPLEKTQIEIAILNANGSISRAAESLGVSRQALYRKMEKLGIVVERRPR